MIGHDSVGPVAIEHTLIEAYEGQTKDNVRIHQRFQSFAKRFGAELPRPGFYTLSVELGAAAGMRGKSDDLVDEVERWVRTEAPKLPEPEIPPSTPNHVRTALPVMLGRLRGGVGDEGSLRVALLLSGDIEAGRVSRTRTSLERKAPKLEAARPPGGATLLVVESWDFLLSNPVVIAQAIYAACQGFSPLPDHITCVDTSAGDGTWRAHGVKSGSQWSAAALEPVVLSRSVCRENYV